MRAVESLEILKLMGPFAQNHIMFQLEDFKGMCHDTEG